MPKNNVFKKSLTEEEALKAIEEYFKGVDHTVETSCGGLVVYVNIMYYDFKPRRQVRNEIEDLASNIEVEEIRREYTDQSILVAYNDMRETDQEIYIKLPDGTLKQIHLDTFMCERLTNRTLPCQKQEATL